MGPFRGEDKNTVRSVVFFLKMTVTFFEFEGFNKQANTRPAKPPSVRLAGFSERGKTRRREDLARLLPIYSVYFK
jgi:hypothetical protein